MLWLECGEMGAMTDIKLFTKLQALFFLGACSLAALAPQALGAQTPASQKQETPDTKARVELSTEAKGTAGASTEAKTTTSKANRPAHIAFWWLKEWNTALHEASEALHHLSSSAQVLKNMFRTKSHPPQTNPRFIPHPTQTFSQIASLAEHNIQKNKTQNKNLSRGARYAEALKAEHRDVLVRNLFQAIYYNNTLRVSQYAARIKEPQLRSLVDEHGYTALHQIVEHATTPDRALKMAKQLVPLTPLTLWQHDASQKRTALHLAALKGWTEVMDYFTNQARQHLQHHWQGGQTKDKTALVEAQLQNWLEAPDAHGFSALDLVAHYSPTKSNSHCAQHLTSR